MSGSDGELGTSMMSAGSILRFFALLLGLITCRAVQTSKQPYSENLHLRVSSLQLVWVAGSQSSNEVTPLKLNFRQSEFDPTKSTTTLLLYFDVVDSESQSQAIRQRNTISDLGLEPKMASNIQST